MKATIPKRRQISIPEQIRREMHLEPGQAVFKRISSTKCRFTVEPQPVTKPDNARRGRFRPAPPTPGSEARNSGSSILNRGRLPCSASIVTGRVTMRNDLSYGCHDRDFSRFPALTWRLPGGEIDPHSRRCHLLLFDICCEAQPQPRGFPRLFLSVKQRLELDRATPRRLIRRRSNVKRTIT